MKRPVSPRSRLRAPHAVGSLILGCVIVAGAAVALLAGAGHGGRAGDVVSHFRPKPVCDPARLAAAARGGDVLMGSFRLRVLLEDTGGPCVLRDSSTRLVLSDGSVLATLRGSDSSGRTDVTASAPVALLLSLGASCSTDPRAPVHVHLATSSGEIPLPPVRLPSTVRSCAATLDAVAPEPAR